MPCPHTNSTSLAALWLSGRPEPGAAGAELPPAAPPSSAAGPGSCSRALRGNPAVVTPPHGGPAPSRPRRSLPALSPRCPPGPVAKGPLLRTNIRVLPRACAVSHTDHVTLGRWRRPWGGVRGAERSFFGVCRCHVAAYREESPQWGEESVRCRG